LTALGFLTEDDAVELLEGCLVLKKPRNPPHDGTLHWVHKRVAKVLPQGWDLRVQSAVRLSDSEPEPDVAIVREDPAGYTMRHPTAADVGLLIEVSDSSLAGDRTDKGRIYACAAIAHCWILNLVDRQVEVYASPTGPTAMPVYSQRQDYRLGQTVMLTLDGRAIADIAVQDLLP
jgi:Uma2 family endonuclease